MNALPIFRVVLYKHGVGYFERSGSIHGEATCSLTFKQSEVSDVLKSLTVLDLDGGHIASVSYDSTKPLEQLLDEVAISIPDENSLVGLLPQIKGARVAVVPAGGSPMEGVILGVDRVSRQSADGIVTVMMMSILNDQGSVQQVDLHDLAGLEILDASLRRDLEYYLRTQLSAKKKDARTFTFFARGEGDRRVQISYTLEAPVWKATYRILLEGKETPPMIQGWAVVDNTQDEDWENVTLSLIAGLPVSFVHDLYTPRYIRRPVVAVQETTGVLPPVVEEGMAVNREMLFDAAIDATETQMAPMAAAAPAGYGAAQRKAAKLDRVRATAVSAPAQVRERKLGDLFEYEIEHPVTIKRNQSALVPIVLKPFDGRSVLLHNRNTRSSNPMRSVEFKNTTNLTLEGGPVTVLEEGSYVGEAMLETLKPDEQRLVPYAVELSVHVLDNIESWSEKVHRVLIRDGRLNEYSSSVQLTTYHFDNKSETEQVLYLDHPRPGSEWSLIETPDPMETTDNYWRFRFTLPKKKVTAFAVKVQQPTRQIQMLRDLDANRLGLWLDQKYVDAATEKILRQVIEEQHRVADLERQLTRLNEEQNRITTEQQRIRENLQALGDRTSEKELRERFVRTLNVQEDRLEQISSEVNLCTQDRDKARQGINQLLASLEYEGRAK